jgi:3-deoxy-D-manno-octulosonate 8-phosphate phosphatase (KDO 8-P phosphatase)
VPPDSPTLPERLQAIELLVLDVDGVMTDGGITYLEGGEAKQFHVRDGSGLKIWHFAGKRSAIITGRVSRIVERRAAELGVSPVIQGAEFKLPALRRLLESTGVRAEQACAICDDVPDLGLLVNCGLAVAVADAAPEARAAAHYVTQAPGGRGAVREVIELILRAQGRWAAVVDRFRNERL